VQAVNTAMAKLSQSVGNDQKLHLGVLDIFGFEVSNPSFRFFLTALILNFNVKC